MKSQEWKTYRTRFLIKAKQLTSALSFTDQLGRQHCGRKGDYLVESYEGVLSIAPRHIFEDIYVPMALHGSPSQTLESDQNIVDAIGDLNHVQVEELRIEKIQDSNLRLSLTHPLHKHPPTSPRGRRKSPQPVRHTAARVGLM